MNWNISGRMGTIIGERRPDSTKRGKLSASGKRLHGLHPHNQPAAFDFLQNEPHLLHTEILAATSANFGGQIHVGGLLARRKLNVHIQKIHGNRRDGEEACLRLPWIFWM